MMAAVASENNLPATKSRSPSSIVNFNEPGKVIAFVKTYPANKIQPGLINVPLRSLEEVPLEKWLASVLGNATLEWKGGDCAAYDSDSDDNGEHCVSLLVSVSTLKDHCPSIELRFIVNQDATVYLTQIIH